MKHLHEKYIHHPSNQVQRPQVYTHSKNRRSGGAKLSALFEGMDKLVGALAHIGEIKVRNDDDGIDRLSRRYTTLFMVLFSLLVSTKQYVGDPINCWVPAQFTNNHEEYTNKVCWVSNTYYLPFDEKKIPEKDESKMQIGYYQWIPMILLCQACMFYLPCLMWRILARKSGLSIKTIVDSAMSCHRATFSDNREKIIRYTVVHMDAYLGARQPAANGCWQRIKKALSKRCLCICGNVYGNYLTFLYLFVKFCYILNCVGQLFMLNVFLGTDYHMFGVNVVLSLLKGKDWKSSTRFPRVTLCDFEVRQLGSVHRHTVQCVLPINLFNEKIFIFIWFWFVLVAIITLLSWFHWCGRAIHRGSQVDYIKRQLRALDKMNRETEARTVRFTQDYMRQDGVFICRLIAKNAGDIIAAEVIGGLWDHYSKRYRLLDGTAGSPPSTNTRSDVFMA